MAALRRPLWRLSLLFWSARLVPWRAALRLHDRSATVVVWIHGRKSESWLSYLLHEDTVMMDAALLRALAQRQVPFRLVFGHGIRGVRDSTVVYTIHPYNPSRAAIRSEGLRHALAAVAGRGNRLVPTLDAVRFWENKVHMHERLDEVGARTPATTIVRSLPELDDLELQFPLMVKDPWSYGAYGVERVADRPALEASIAGVLGSGRDAVIVQEFIDIRADARVTVAAGRVVHDFVRNNPGDAWSITHARYGTTYAFGAVPESWHDYLSGLAEQLDLMTAAFDACWDSEDPNGDPIVFEVSPAYQLNPEPPEAFSGRPYQEYASTWWGRDSHPARQTALVAEVQAATLERVTFP